MKLPAPSVAKLFREDFPGESPIVIDRAKVPQEAKEWQKRLGAIEGVQVSQHPGDRDSRSRTLCRFTIPDPQNDVHYWRSDELRLEFDDEARLVLQTYKQRNPEHSGLVSSLDELKSFVRHVRERYAKRHANAKKREKVREFKSQAIIAQVKKLAREEQFDFATKTDTQKLKLFVKLSKHHLIEIDVPFTRFEKALPKLRDTIQSLRELYAEGLRFKIAPIGHLPWDTQWIEHGSLDGGMPVGEEANH
ncbi:MAG: hypothetical protein AAFX06_06535 [Planctomycetota bacterium]